METERNYYIAGGKDLEKTLDFIQQRETSREEIREKAEKYGAKSGATNGFFIGGLIFENGEAPLGWIEKGRTNDNEPFFLPRRSTKMNREICKDINSVRVPSMAQFNGMFCKDGGVLKEGEGFSMRRLYISWEKVKDTILLSVPIGSEFTPDGSTPLKMSEYWALKEEAGL